MTSCGCLTIRHPPQVAMERRQPSSHQGAAAAEEPDARVISDETVGGESEEESSASARPYRSESSMSSSFSSDSSSSDTSEEGEQQQDAPQQQQQQQQPSLRRRAVALRDGEITSPSGCPSMPNTAIVRRRPLHETLGESNDDDDFEVALSWHRNKRILLGRLTESAPHGRLSLINLCRRGIGEKEALLVKEAIITNPQLSVIKLSYNDLRDAGAKIIAEAISANSTHHPSLKSLDLGFNAIGDPGCEAISVHVLAGNYALDTLYLSGNKIGEKGALSIAGAMLHGSALTQLHLTANSIGSNGLKAICGAIAQVDAKIQMDLQQQRQQQHGTGYRRKSLQQLFLGDAGFNESGFIAVPGMLLTNSTLKSICLTNNNITDQGMMLMSQALSQNKNVPLENLELSFNEITDQGLEFLMNSVWGSTTLKKLKLDNNKIQDRGAQLCAVVLTSIPLELLDISYNRVTTVGIRAIMKNVSENESLKTFAMAGVPIDQNSSKAISYALAYNSSLNVLRMDNCSAGYSSQRHIVAGMVSNCRGSLRVFTGFYIAPIAMTLGMPRLPETWSNEQVLGFVRLMWQQWLFKSGRGNPQDINSVAKGPAPPAAVAAAAKIAFTALGTNPEQIFFSEEYSRPVTEVSPIDPAGSALMERTNSGTLRSPELAESPECTIHEWFEGDTHPHPGSSGQKSALLRSPLEDPEKRNRNLQWLRLHFRSLSQIGRLPFNRADLWQLHQYYFSPPIANTDDEGGDDSDDTGNPKRSKSASPHARPDGEKIGCAVSFRSLGDAHALTGPLSDHASAALHKRSHDDTEENQEPATKKAKSLKPRVAFYPRVMAKIQTLGAKPTEQMLSLLRQLKYTENAMFGGNDPYDEAARSIGIRSDIEMVLLDLF